MAETPVKIIVNCETGDVQEIPLSPEEIQEREALAAQAEADRLAREAEEQASLAAKESAKAKLAALGLSDAEITALIS